MAGPIRRDDQYVGRRTGREPWRLGQLRDFLTGMQMRQGPPGSVVERYPIRAIYCGDKRAETKEAAERGGLRRSEKFALDYFF